MMLLMPFKDFRTTATVLDDQLLSVQIDLAADVIESLEAKSGPVWPDPEAQAWRFHVPALRAYLHELLVEFDRRYPSLRGTYERKHLALDEFMPHLTASPDWYMWMPYHNGHMGWLYRRDPERYCQFKGLANVPVIVPVLDDDGSFVDWVERVPMGHNRAPRYRKMNNAVDSRTYPTAASACGMSV
jgi:hypothetical protein